MKKIALLAFGLALFSCASKDKLEIGNKTTLSVNDTFNAGKVMLGEEIEASFTLKNTGKYPLILAEVKGECSCTVAEFPEDPIEPGETGKITATVRTDNAAEGMLSKGVRIIANTEPSLTKLTIKAEITRK
jgi:uncharacterized membrane protein